MSLESAVQAALAAMITGPKPLERSVRFHAEVDDLPDDLDSAISKRVLSGPNDPVRRAIHAHLSAWDFASGPEWARQVMPNTRERRLRIYELLGLGESLQSAIEAFLPVWESGGDIVIDNAQDRPDWFTAEFRRGHEFYWTRYKEYLRKQKGRSEVSLAMLDEGTTRVVERLADPSSKSKRSARGLVVGHVQSGKTANFTGVIAKSIDAGYRLIVVLSGTMDLLRNQTQRRIDMELAGVENIIQGGDPDAEHDYRGDPDWPDRFISYGAAPAKLGSVDIVRLTRESDDFRSLASGIRALQFEKVELQKPLRAPVNLDKCAARLVVIKKNARRLSKLLRDLKQVGKAQCDEVPALIIDDESDQASVNTVKPTPAVERERTAINRCIVRLLEALPRAQYVGYTATPFANVFVDPRDAADIYPRDFIIALDRPAGYVGASDFQDLEPVPSGTLANEEAYVRGIVATKRGADDRLMEAIDAFVLTGALKVYRRERNVEGDFRHHTMLIHESPLQKVQFEKRAEVLDLWNAGSYFAPASRVRMERLLEEDFRPVWEARGRDASLPFPRNFVDLRASLGVALNRMSDADGPVLVVNGDPRADVPDFDRARHVWKIVIGGAKLSRGYTVEGLTISYFRRRARTQDTLMQMGRWFGYRNGYHDLVRLYIGREEPLGRQVFDLFEAFQATCADEDEFRRQLAQYARPADGSRPLTPLQVPALVFNSHPLLRPTTKNKMFNAKVSLLDFDHRQPTQQAVDKLGRVHNADLFRELLEEGVLRTTLVHGPQECGINFNAAWCEVQNERMVQVLEALRWTKGIVCLAAEVNALRTEPRPVDRWLVILPQLLKAASPSWVVGGQSLTTVARKYLGSRFGIFSDPTHVKLAERLVGSDGALDVRTEPRLRHGPKTGVMLLYPTYESEEKPAGRPPVMGFALFLPKRGTGTRVVFSVKA